MVLGLYGSGMHDWIIDELELGRRVAHCLDSENNAKMGVWVDLSYEEYLRTHEDPDTINITRVSDAIEF